MNKYRKAALSIAFLSFLLSGGITNGSVKVSNLDDNLSHASQEEEILSSFEASDYDYWRKIVPRKSKISEIVNEDIFQEFVVARSLARSGDYDRAIVMASKLEDELKTKMYLIS